MERCMKIAVIGAGYVGLVTAVCLSEVGHDVMVVDNDMGRITLLQAGTVPIHEPGIDLLITNNAAAGRLQFTAAMSRAVDHAEVIFIAVGTPPMEDGSADLRYVLSAAGEIGRVMKSFKVIVNKSTVPVGSAALVHSEIQRVLQDRDVAESVVFSVTSNPEFLREGDAIVDFMSPDRVVIGLSNDGHYSRTKTLMEKVYQPLVASPAQIIWMDCASSELTKYAANAMLATRISFMNEVAALAEKVGADIDFIRMGIGSDKRIGKSFLQAGTGYGGSCFPKDTKALVQSAHACGLRMRVVEAVEEVNDAQKNILVDAVVERFGENLRGRQFAIWGLAFKPNTNDMREAPSRVVIEALLRRGAKIAAFDPVAMDEAARVLSDDLGLSIARVPQFSFAIDAMSALANADALLVLTEWDEFKQADLAQVKHALASPIVLDGRNIFSLTETASLGLVYQGIGRCNSLAQAAGNSAPTALNTCAESGYSKARLSA
jgi:UDPglucose 6-dehydrogenase